jgi:hypothetical protein
MKKLLALCILVLASSPLWAPMIFGPIQCQNYNVSPPTGCSIPFSWYSSTCAANGYNPPAPSTCSWPGQTYDIPQTATSVVQGEQLIESKVALATAALSGYLTGSGLSISSYTTWGQNYTNTVCSGTFCQ